METPFEKLLHKLAGKSEDFIEEYKRKMKELNDKLKK